MGLKPFQGRQIFQWMHQRRVFDPHAMTNLAKPLRQSLAETCSLGALRMLDVSESGRSEGTKKALFALPDGETVETVLIRDRDRTTICLSSQVGCAVKCSFCATGLSGFKRNLSPGEIAEQALRILDGEDLGGKSPNIVYMGMGEPFRNYEAVVKSIRLLMDKDGLNIGARRITVSTVGETDGIRRFAGEPWQVRLSVSLHAANDKLRSGLVPLNRKYPLSALRESILDYVSESGRQVTFEWALLDGVNDSMKDAGELCDFVGNLKATVNLIPYNPVHGLDYSAPPQEKCEAFRDAVEARGVRATLRKERGQDIDAACGQLRRRADAARTG